jgi:hypothetical protein
MYLGVMTKYPGEATKIAAGIHLLLEDETHGRRSLRWLSEKAAIPYSTLQGKLASDPSRLTLGELFRIADALGVGIADLYVDIEPMELPRAG